MQTFILQNSDAMKAMVAMTLFSLTLPSRDSFVSMIEILSEFVTTSNSNPQISLFLTHLLHLPQCESVQDDPIPQGIWIILFLIVNQCSLPLSVLQSHSKFVNPLVLKDDEDEIRDYRITEAR
jgi:hypothetical protein